MHYNDKYFYSGTDNLMIICRYVIKGCKLMVLMDVEDNIGNIRRQPDWILQADDTVRCLTPLSKVKPN